MKISFICKKMVSGHAVLWSVRFALAHFCPLFLQMCGSPFDIFLPCFGVLCELFIFCNKFI